jgi:hypothetical protein
MVKERIKDKRKEERQRKIGKNNKMRIKKTKKQKENRKLKKRNTDNM